MGAVETDKETKRSEKKSWMEFAVMPLVLAFLAWWSTTSINREQQNQTKAVTDAQLESAELTASAQLQSAEKVARRENVLKALELFNQSILKGDPAARSLAVRLLPAIDPELGRALAAEIAAREKDPAVQKIAIEASKDAVRNEVASLVAAFTTPVRRTASMRLRHLHETGDAATKTEVVQQLVAAVLPEREPLSYRINLYIALTLSLLQSWTASDDARLVIAGLQKTQSYQDPTFKARVDGALEKYRRDSGAN